MPRGRPRTFDADKSLHAAMMLFWRHGYEGTSLSALTRAMRISGPSLYNAFGDKRTLFHKTLLFVSALSLAPLPWKKIGSAGAGSNLFPIRRPYAGP